jgi:hypothetical protein
LASSSWRSGARPWPCDACHVHLWFRKEAERRAAFAKADSGCGKQIPNCWIHRWGSPAQVCEAHARETPGQVGVGEGMLGLCKCVPPKPVVGGWLRLWLGSVTARHEHSGFGARRIHHMRNQEGPSTNLSSATKDPRARPACIWICTKIESKHSTFPVSTRTQRSHGFRSSHAAHERDEHRWHQGSAQGGAH